MGLTHVVVRLFNSDSTEKYEADFLVDMGALLSMAPAANLKEIGMRPAGKSLYELANGEHVEYEHGFAEMEFMGATVVTHIIFGPDDSEPFLGVVALETAGFIVDPLTRRLKKLSALPLKRVA